MAYYRDNSHKVLIKNFEKQLKFLTKFIPDETIINRWKEVVSLIPQLPQLNMEMLAITFVYNYINYSDIIKIGMTPEDKTNFWRILFSTPIKEETLISLVRELFVTKKVKRKHMHI